MSSCKHLTATSFVSSASPVRLHSRHRSRRLQRQHCECICQVLPGKCRTEEKRRRRSEVRGRPKTGWFLPGMLKKSMSGSSGIMSTVFCLVGMNAMPLSGTVPRYCRLSAEACMGCTLEAERSAVDAAVQQRSECGQQRGIKDPGHLRSPAESVKRNLQEQYCTVGPRWRSVHIDKLYRQEVLHRKAETAETSSCTALLRMHAKQRVDAMCKAVDHADT